MCTPVQALRPCTGRTAHRGSRGIAIPFHDHGSRRGWGVSVTPRPLFTPWKDPVPIVHEAGWAQGRRGQVRKISPPPGFDPRTVQPLASRYSDYATRPTPMLYPYIKHWIRQSSLEPCSTRFLLAVDINGRGLRRGMENFTSHKHITFKFLSNNGSN